MTDRAVTDRLGLPGLDDTTATDDFPNRYARTARFSLGSPRNLTVIDDGARVLFCRSKSGEDPVLCLWSFDVSAGVETLLVDPAELGADGGDLPAAERARRERARESALGIVSYSVSGDGSRSCFALGGALFVLELGDGRVWSPEAADAVFDPRLDHYGSAIAYCSGGALRLCSLPDAGSAGGPSSGDDVELRASDDPLVSHGRAEFVAGEEMSRTRGYWWAPDGSRLIAARVAEHDVAEWWIADPAHPNRPATGVRYPAAGTANASVSLELVGLDGSVREIDWSDGGRFEYLADVVWPSGHRPLVVRQTREQRLVSLADIVLDEGPAAALGASDDSALLVVERATITDDVWVELMPGSPHICDAGLLTIEDLADRRALMLDGQAISPEGLQVRSIVGTVSAEPSPADDGAQLTAIVTAWTDPTEVHVMAVPLSLDGAASAMPLTKEPGVHGAVVGGSTVVITSASPSRPGNRILVDRLAQSSLSGTSVGEITDHSAGPGFAADPFFVSLGPDELRSAVFLPSGHDGTEPLSVLLDPYGGPHAQRVLKTHNPHLVSRWFAEQGSAVVVTDGRGTPGRGPAWEREVWGDLATPILDDQVVALDHALARYPFLDRDRVAIRGWSFGGYLAALAVLRRPDRFHAGLAGAPVTSWRLYDTHYTERYLGHPNEHPEHYDRSDVYLDGPDGPVVPDLTRPLLLIHGLADDNVVSAHTLRLSTALLATGSPHRVLPLSGVTHMTPQVAVAENLLRLQADFLDETIGLSRWTGSAAP